MRPYGKVRSNVYEDSPQTISKKSARQLEKSEIREQLEQTPFDFLNQTDLCLGKTLATVGDSFE